MDICYETKLQQVFLSDYTSHMITVGVRRNRGYESVYLPLCKVGYTPLSHPRRRRGLVIVYGTVYLEELI